MKKLISVILSICFMFCGFSANASGDFQLINQRARSITPWLTNYQFQSVQSAETGMNSGEGCQRIFSLGISPVNENYLLYSLDTHMLFRSDDGGESWKNSYEGFMPWAATSILFHPTEEQTAFCVGSGPNDSANTKKYLADADKIGVYKTIDAGKTWTQVLSADMFISVYYTDMLLAFDDAENLYAVSNSKLFKSKAPYNRWEIVYQYDFGSSFDINVSKDGTEILIASEKGLLASSDSGNTFINKNIRNYDVSCYGISVDPRDDKHWIASFGAPFESVFESKDAGKTWYGFNTLKKSVENGSAKVGFGPVRDDGSVWLYARNRVTPSFSFSRDGGKTWENAYVDDYDTILPGEFGNIPEGLAISEINPDLVFYAFKGRIYKSVDGGRTFKYSSVGSSGLYPMYMKRDEKGILWLGTADNNLIHTTEPFDGKNFPTMNEVFKTISRYVTAFDFDPDDPKHMIICFAKSSSGNLKESFDGGTTFVDIPNTPTGQELVIKYHPENHDIIYTTSYISRDNGKTWDLNEYNGHTVKIHSVSSVDPNILWGESQGRYVCVSRDAGITWKVVFDIKKLNPDPNSTDIDYSIKQIVADVSDASSVYFIANSSSLKYGVTLKYDGKNIKVLRDPQGETGYRFAFVQNPNNPQHILVSYANPDEYYYKSNGVYESYNGGVTWHVVPGLPSAACIRNMMWDEELDIVYMGGFIGFYIYTPEKLKSQIKIQ